MMEGIYLLLGSNLGDKKKQLQTAENLISKEIGPILKKSSIYETAAWGNITQPGFYNQVLNISSALSPEEVLEKINTIEHELGRVRKEKWGARIIDIDILYYGNRVISSENLSVPHPGIPDRRFTLVPLAEVAPGFIHPVIKKSNADLLRDCPDMLKVTPVEDSGPISS